MREGPNLTVKKELLWCHVFNSLYVHLPPERNLPGKRDIVSDCLSTPD